MRHVGRQVQEIARPQRVRLAGHRELARELLDRRQYLVGLGSAGCFRLPDPLGEIYEYMPNITEISISLGIWAFGLLIFTLFMRIAIPIQRGDLIHSKLDRATTPTP